MNRSKLMRRMSVIVALVAVLAVAAGIPLSRLNPRPVRSPPARRRSGMVIAVRRTFRSA